MRNRRFVATVLLTCLSLATIFFSISRASMNSEGLAVAGSQLSPQQPDKLKQVPQMVRNAKSAGAEFERRELFQAGVQRVAGDAQFSRILADGTILNLDQAAVQRIINENVEFLNLPLPDGKGGSIELELVKVNIFAPGFSVTTAKPTSQPTNDGLGVHYRGIVKGDDHSVAAISIFKNEVMGFFSTETDGNSVVGRLGGNNPTDKHIVYAERDMKVSSPFHCETKDDATVSVPQSILQEPETPQANCVKIYLEANYDLYQNKGSSVPNVNSFVTGLFNQSATLYNNDGVSIVLSQLFVWNSPSPFTGAATASAQMDQFFSTRQTFNGDVAHLLALQLALGGVTRGRVCNHGHSISNLVPDYQNVPTYSWSVYCFTHETGHVLGSEHTHACFWNGNDTAIDGCGPAAGYPYEGSCSGAPIPASGTIMSYCHLSPNPGINFTNGFGPQPKAYIQNFIANGSCLTACGAGVGAGNVRADFDGDRKTDVGVFRASNDAWYLSQSTAGFAGTAFGAPGDVATPADFDGDGKTDIAVFRPANGAWYLLRSQLGFTGISFGANGDVPVPGDFDGDDKADLAVFRPSTGVWYIQQSQNGFLAISFGTNGDVPVVEDYDGDGRADVAVYRPSTGVWYIQRSAQGFIGIAFGASGDKAAAADFDGDGKTDVAVFRPSNGTWYLQRSTLGFTAVAFGANGDKPAPGDYDGDGKADVAVFRPTTGSWYIQRSQLGFFGQAFGANGDVPAAGAYIP